MADKTPTSQQLIKYQGNYSEDKFWKKLRKFASKAGAKAVYYALVLYYTLADPATPMKYKAVIAGALGYFILPLDILPDFLPFAGMADDWAALIAAVTYVFRAITPASKAQARDKFLSWFPDADASSMGDLS